MLRVAALRLGAMCAAGTATTAAVVAASESGAGGEARGSVAHCAGGFFGRRKGSGGLDELTGDAELRANAGDDERVTRVLAVAQQLANEAEVVVATTIDQDGYPHTRLMAPLQVDTGLGCIWLSTNKYTRKVTELLHNQRMSLLFYDKAGNGYASLVGDVQLSVDDSLRSTLWKDELLMFYSDGPLGDRFLLLRVEPHRLEVSSERHRVANDPNAWRPEVLVRDGQHGIWRSAPPPPEPLLRKLRAE